MSHEEPTIPKQTSLNDIDPMKAAMALAEGGWPVFPVYEPTTGGVCSCKDGGACDSPAKHPRTLRGLTEATTEGDQIRSWWGKWPHSNIGLLTGSKSGLVVLDLDGDPDLLIKELGELGITWDTTPVSRTGGGGRHIFFRHPGGHVTPKIGLLRLQSVNGGKPPQLDIRADGSYIVAPPSVHISGRRYLWELDPLFTQLAPLPAGVLTLIQTASHQPLSESSPTGGESWVLSALRGPINEGLRNQTATRLAGHFLAQSRNDVEEVVALLTLWAETVCNPQMGLRELRKTVESIARAERAQVSIDEHLTDLGNAKRLVARHGQDLRHVRVWGWLPWDGTRWERDQTGQVIRWAKATIGSMYSEAGSQSDEPTRKAMGQHALRSEADSKIKAMIHLAESEPEVAIRPDQFDRDPWSFNCVNGTIDLKTVTLREHRREDLITKLAPVIFDPKATCPTFDRFLDRIMSGSGNLIEYLQLAIGCSLAGVVYDHVLFVLFGGGANGKSTLLNIILWLFGDYGKRAAPGLLMRKYGETHPTEVADLHGARFVASIEVEEGKRLAEVLTKELTGGDRLKARRMREDFWEFDPTFKLFLAVNHKPTIKGTDEAIWRRIRQVPFGVAIPKAEQDTRLLEKLKAEAPGILNWALRGCLLWQRSGLKEPPEVEAATKEYRQEQDVVGDFLDACCTVSPSVRVLAGDLYARYTKWAEETGEKPVSQKRLGASLGNRGFVGRRTNLGHTWFGLEIVQTQKA